jgi:hypothetical protein
MWYPAALTNPNFAMFVVVGLLLACCSGGSTGPSILLYYAENGNELGTADSKPRKVPLGRAHGMLESTVPDHYVPRNGQAPAHYVGSGIRWESLRVGELDA